MDDTTQPMTASQIIKEHKEEIVRLWESMVRKRIRPARREPRWIVRDHIPPFLDSLAESLDPNVNKESACEDNDNCAKHGEERAKGSNYRPKELVEEFGLLRESIFEIVRTHGTLTSRDIDIVLRSIDDGVMESIQAFTETVSKNA